jgi:Putative Ig domain
MRRIMKLVPLLLLSALIFSGSGGNASSILIPPAAEQLEVTTDAIPDLTVNHPYALRLLAKGGTPPYVWSLAEGTLPPGLHVTTDGWLTGTPTEMRSDDFVVRVTDATKNTAEISMEFTSEDTSPDEPNQRRRETSQISTRSIPKGYRDRSKAESVVLRALLTI